VFRTFLVAAVLCLSFETSGLGAAFGDRPCSEDCPTDKSGGQCPPNCPFCSCCCTPKSLILAMTAVTPILSIDCVAWSAATLQLASPPPRAILHVPKLVLA
jgi:hypothetical protein